MTTAICTNGKSPLQIATEWMDAAARCDLPAIEAGMAEGCKRYGEPNWMLIEKADYIASYRQYLISFSDYKLDILNTMTSGMTTVFEMIESATFSQPYPLPDGRVIKPNGVVGRNLVVPSYFASKRALDRLSNVIAPELRKSGVYVIGMHPGWVATEIVTARLEGQGSIPRKAIPAPSQPAPRRG